MMADKQKIPYPVALEIAQTLTARLMPYCERIAIAGSVRREKPEIGDIEIVAIPRKAYDFFGFETGDHALNSVEWSEFGKLIKNGSKYKQIELHEGINLDLFIVTPPAQWGVQLMIRTGSADFSHRLVTSRQFGGLMPSNYKVKDGAIWSSNHVIETPEEEDVFNLIGVPFIEPALRVK